MLSIALLLVLTACATPTKMAFDNDKQVVAERGNPIFLLSVTIKNNYRPSFQPQLRVAYLEVPGATDSPRRFNFTMDNKGKSETNKLPDGNSYLLRMELAPGTYDFVGLGSWVHSFPIVANFFTPVHAQIVAAGSGVYYLGHIQATLRERRGNEFKAGPSIPLLDQAVAGASGGTFDVEISDALATDEPRFKLMFPALKSVAIKQAILPPFNIAKAQQWWEAH